MSELINIPIHPSDIPFLKRAILGRARSIIDHIDHHVYNDKKITEEEIQDIEIDQFQAELREMIAKHTPKKLGRPKGSKNKVKTNAE